MTKRNSRLLLGIAQVGLGLAALGSNAHADTAATTSAAATATPDVQVEEVIVTGVRGAQPRTNANSPVPIDIVSAQQLTETGKTGLKEILGAEIPSLTLPAQNGGGTSASVPPIAVDGLSGDYVLVLVNGKRRHSTALINNLATISGGSTPVDLDLLPVSAIDHIEYLRDGAAAQYGSDAITGVINIILKTSARGGSADTTSGETYNRQGQLVQEEFDVGHDFFNGFINFAAAYVHHDPATAISDGPATGLLYPLVNGQPDPREATGNRNYGSAYGDSTLLNGLNLAYNLSTPVGDGLEAYSFTTLSFSNIKDARGAYRPDDLSSLPQIYPNGFQAYRLIHQTDFQVAGGLKGTLFGWRWDASSTFGRDFARLGADDTLNASLGPTVTQTSFYMGEDIFDQWTNNLDVTRAFNIGLAKPLDVSWGFEHRWEQFAEVAGEPNSYIDGGYVVPNGGTPFDNLYHGQLPTAGLQSFTGTTPADASTHNRNNYAAYVDLGTNLTKPWYVALAGRAEHYDDSSGNTLSGKATSRYEILPGLAIRGSISNGFRAPSLAEEYFSTTQNTIGFTSTGAQYTLQSKFLPANGAIAAALGATPLKPEESINYSGGLTYEPTHNLRFTADVYEIDINNRIVKSSQITGTEVQNILAPLGFSGLGAAQYFTNAVNTRTDGVDLVGEYRQDLHQFGIVHWSAAYTLNSSVITHIKANPAVLNGYGYVEFNGQSQRQLTESTPKDRLQLGADWTKDKWRLHLLETRYGPYDEPNSVEAQDWHFSPKWITDLEVSYQVTPSVTLAVGANNILNVYPDRKPSEVALDTVLTGAPGYSAAAYGVPTSGASIYGTNSPFGLTGGFYYGRLGVKF